MDLRYVDAGLALSGIQPFGEDLDGGGTGAGQFAFTFAVPAQSGAGPS